MLYKFLAVSVWLVPVLKGDQGDRCQFELFPEGPQFLTNPPTVLVKKPRVLKLSGQTGFSAGHWGWTLASTPPTHRP